MASHSGIQDVPVVPNSGSGTGDPGFVMHMGINDGAGGVCEKRKPPQPDLRVGWVTQHVDSTPAHRAAVGHPVAGANRASSVQFSQFSSVQFR